MIRSFIRNRSGAAVVELALVAPVIGAMVLISFGVWEVSARKQDMRTALGAASLYYMNGGSNDSAAETVAFDAWDSRPQGAALTSVRVCRCGSTVALCTDLCAGSKPPSVFVKLTATATASGVMFTPTLTEERVVRVR